MAASLPLPTGSASCCQETALPGTPGAVYQRRRGPGVAWAELPPQRRQMQSGDQIRNSKLETRNKFQARNSKDARSDIDLNQPFWLSVVKVVAGFDSIEAEWA